MADWDRTYAAGSDRGEEPRDARESTAQEYAQSAPWIVSENGTYTLDTSRDTSPYAMASAASTSQRPRLPRLGRQGRQPAPKQPAPKPKPQSRPIDDVTRERRPLAQPSAQPNRGGWVGGVSADQTVPPRVRGTAPAPASSVPAATRGVSAAPQRPERQPGIAPSATKEAHPAPRPARTTQKSGGKAGQTGSAQRVHGTQPATVDQAQNSGASVSLHLVQGGSSTQTDARTRAAAPQAQRTPRPAAQPQQDTRRSEPQAAQTRRPAVALRAQQQAPRAAQPQQQVHQAGNPMELLGGLFHQKANDQRPSSERSHHNDRPAPAPHDVSSSQAARPTYAVESGFGHGSALPEEDRRAASVAQRASASVAASIQRDRDLRDPRSERHLSLGLGVITTLLIFIIVCAMLYSPMQQFYLVWRENERLADELQHIVARNTAMRNRFELLRTNEGIVDVAHELGYVAEGENYVMVFGIDSPLETTIPPEVKRGSGQNTHSQLTDMLDSVFGVVDVSTATETHSEVARISDQ